MEVDFLEKYFIKLKIKISLDPPVGEEWDPKKSDFRYGIDLVKFIRQHFDDYFVICVAGKLNYIFSSND